MKRFLLIVLALAAAALLFSCSGGTDAPAESGGQSGQTQPAGNESREADPVSAASAVEPSAAESTAADPDQPSVSEPDEPNPGGTDLAPDETEGLGIKVYDSGCEVWDIGTFTGTALIIPSHVNGIPVTSIEEDALTNDTMVSLEIPWTVVSIGEEAVSDSHALETVTFYKGLIGIGYGAFASCTALKTVELPSTLERLGGSAFRSCTALTEVTLYCNPEVGSRAFSECTSLEKVTFDSGSFRTYSLQSSAFEFDAALKEVTFSEGLDTIGSFCFSGCSSLGTVYLPASLKTIGTNAFSGVGTLKVVYAGTEEQWKSVSVGAGNEALSGAEITFS
ncbi:MAG: leucine-rich repeat protein [Clostridia bacterium]|nr:leucine-rich repeat protein [Clostridia bacterium]